MFIDPERILQVQDSKLVQCFLCKTMSAQAKKHSDDGPLWWIKALALCSVVLAKIIERDFDVTGETTDENLEKFALNVQEAMTEPCGPLDNDEVRYIGALSEKIVNKAKACLEETGERR